MRARKCKRKVTGQPPCKAGILDGVMGYWGNGEVPSGDACGGEKAFSHQFCSNVSMVYFFLVAEGVKKCPKDAIPSPQSPISPSPRFLIAEFYWPGTFSYKIQAQVSSRT
jgi:hypothetical protein